MKHMLLVTDALNSYMLDSFRRESKRYDIDLHMYWEPVRDDICVTLNRRYFEKFIPIQQGIQLNRQVDGIFWKDKIRQHMILPTYCRKPTTVIGREFGYQYLVEHLGSPFIAKENISSKGKGVFLINSIADYNTHSNCILFQEVIWDSLGKDIRVFCIAGKPVRCMLRHNESNFRSNAHQGGIGNKYQTDNDIVSIVDSIYKCTKLDIMGIDLLLDKEGYVFCELNANPGFEELDKTWDANTASDILEYSLSRL